MRRLESLSFKQLRALEAVSRTGAISDAAAEIGLTAPAVHSQLKTLEENFDAQLLDRRAAGRFVATPEGDALIAAYEAARGRLEMAVNQINALKAGHAGHVVIGVVSTGKYFAPDLVALLRDAYPNVDISLRVGNRNQMIAALETESVDLMIMGRPPRFPAVVATPIGEHPHVLIAPPDHPLATRRSVLPEDILTQPFLVREPGSGTRILTERYLDRIGDGRVYETAEMESNETIKQAVIAGLGIALISGHTVTEELRSGRLATIRAKGLPIMRHWYLIHREEYDLPGAQQQVRDFIEQQNGAFLPQVLMT